MAISRFDQPAKANFVNTYVPLPFEELAQAAGARQQKYDENLNRLDAARAGIDKIQYIPNSADEERVKEIQSKLANIADSYLDKDLSDPEIYRSLRSDYKSIIDPTELQNIQKSFQGYQNYQNVLAKQVAKGEVADPSLLESFEGYDTYGQGVFDRLPREYVDIDAAANKFFAPVEEEFLGMFDIEGEPAYKEARHGRNAAKLAEYAEANAESFANTAAGRYIVDLAKKQGDDRDASAIVNDFLQSRVPGLTKTRSRILANTAYNPSGPNGGINQWIAPTDNTSSTQVGNIETIGDFDLNRLEKMTNGYEVNYQPGVSTSLFLLAGGNKKDRILDKGEKISETSEEVIKENQTKLNEIKNRFGDDLPKDISDKKLVDIYNKAANGLNNQSLGVKYIQEPEVNDQIRNEIRTGLNNKKFYLYDGHGVVKSGDKLDKDSKLLKELNMNMDEFDEFLQNIPGFMFTQDGPEPGMYMTRVTDKKGRSRNLMISSNNNVQNLTSLSNSINDRIRKLSEKPIVVGKDEAYRVKYKLNPVGKFDYYIEEGRIENNKFIPEGELSLNQIKQIELRSVANSGVIGTTFNWNSLPTNRDMQFSLYD